MILVHYFHQLLLLFFLLDQISFPLIFPLYAKFSSSSNANSYKSDACVNASFASTSGSSASDTSISLNSNVFLMRTIFTVVKSKILHVLTAAFNANLSFANVVEAFVGATTVEVSPFAYVAAKSALSIRRCVVKSAVPTPLALPSVSGVKSSTIILFTSGPPCAYGVG